MSAATDYAHLKAEITAPRLLHSPAPEYTSQAREAKVEGTVVLEAIIDKSGKVAYASMLSPLPCGLDSKALAAVRTWQYAPGVMDKEIIPVLTTIDVVFRLGFQAGDERQEQRRTAIQRTAELGERQIKGDGVPQDVAAGFNKLRDAAENNYTPALVAVAKAELQGTLLPKNETHAWQYFQRAAFFGNAEAQMLWGERTENSGDRNGARYYFRFCAATAHAACEYRLGKLLVTGPDVNPNDFSQGVAWLELAKDHGDKDAAELWKTSAAKLSSLQQDWVAQWKPHLELTHFHGF